MILQLAKKKYDEKMESEGLSKKPVIDPPKVSNRHILNVIYLSIYLSIYLLVYLSFFFCVHFCSRNFISCVSLTIGITKKQADP